MGEGLAHSAGLVLTQHDLPTCLRREVLGLREQRPLQRLVLNLQ
jgi:hypothetical protein